MSTQDLQTIDLAALAQVSGGTSTSTSSASTDAVLTALTGVLNSLQSLGQNNNSGGFNQQEMLLMMMVMQQRNQQANAVAAATGWSWSQEPIVRYY